MAYKKNYKKNYNTKYNKTPDEQGTTPPMFPPIYSCTCGKIRRASILSVDQMYRATAPDSGTTYGSHELDCPIYIKASNESHLAFLREEQKITHELMSDYKNY